MTTQTHSEKKLFNLRQHLRTGQKISFLQYICENKSETKNHKKKSIFWDRQHLYNENIMLRNQIKQFTQTNIKAKTQVLVTQKQVKAMTYRARMEESSQFNLKSVDMSRKVSMDKFSRRFRHQNTGQPSEQDHIVPMMKKLVRELKQKIQQLKSQSNILKKSIKLTRMNQLQIQNKQLMEQNIRLQRIASQMKTIGEQNMHLYMKQVQVLKIQLRRQLERHSNDYKKLGQGNKQLNEIKKKTQLLEQKKNKNQRQMMNQISSFKKEHNLKNKKNVHNQQSYYKTLYEDIKRKYEYTLSIIQKPLSNSITFKSTKNKTLIKQSQPTQLEILTPNKKNQQLRSQLFSLKDSPISHQLRDKNYEDNNFQKVSEDSIKRQQQIQKINQRTNALKKKHKRQQKKSKQVQQLQQLMDQQQGEYEYIDQQEI